MLFCAVVDLVGNTALSKQGKSNKQQNGTKAHNSPQPQLHNGGWWRAKARTRNAKLWRRPKANNSGHTFFMAQRNVREKRGGRKHSPVAPSLSHTLSFPGLTSSLISPPLASHLASRFFCFVVAESLCCREMVDSNTQTPATITSDTAVQSTDLVSVEVQTEDLDELVDRCDFLQPEDDEEAAPVAAFLRAVEPLVSAQLEANALSTAFDGLELEHGTSESSVTHTLRNLALSQEDVQPLAIAFNRIGSVIAVAYGSADKQEWWTASSHICTVSCTCA